MFLISELDCALANIKMYTYEQHQLKYQDTGLSDRLSPFLVLRYTTRLLIIVGFKQSLCSSCTCPRDGNVSLSDTACPRQSALH